MFRRESRRLMPILCKKAICGWKLSKPNIVVIVYLDILMDTILLDLQYAVQKDIA